MVYCGENLLRAEGSDAAFTGYRFPDPGDRRLRMFYGGVMGTYSGVAARALQVVYSAVKVPLLLTATFLLSYPALPSSTR